MRMGENRVAHRVTELCRQVQPFGSSPDEGNKRRIIDDR